MKISKTGFESTKREALEITVASEAGFCSGVKRAVKIAVDAAERHGKAYTLGELVHNKQAVSFLESKNVYAINDTESLPKGSPVIIRSHGVGREVYERLSDYAVYDATCPYVKKIHGLVDEENAVVIIMGDKNHPEVVGIAGHTRGEFYIMGSPEELENFVRNYNEPHKSFGNNALIFVAQTTFNEHKWIYCTRILKKNCTNAKIYDTICNATVKRQQQARELSQSCDAMVVIGDKNSSNSVKLYEICKENCKNTYFVESAADIYNIHNCVSGTIGVTAGASVSAEIIKEVHQIMNVDIKSADEYNQAELDFMAEVDKTFRKIHTGKRVKAYVIAVNTSEAVVDLGTKHSGYIPADEIGGEPGLTPDQVVKPGDEIECIVTKINDAEGVVYLSKKKIDSEMGYEKLAAAYEAGAILEGYVSAVVNGGVIISFEGARVFIPASQSGVPKNGNLETLLKKTVKFKVIEVNEQRKRLVGSIRAASALENDANKEKFWAEIEVGKHFIGEVKSMESYGVFVGLGCVDGMVHLSELAWKRVKHPSEAVNIGDKLEVFVKSYDPDRQRISLTAKNPEDNPWVKFVNEYEVGATVSATIVNITPFGAFAQITPGIDGLIHISQISLDRVKNTNDVLTIGQVVEAQITEIDVDKERVSLSIKALLKSDSDDSDGENENGGNDNEQAQADEAVATEATETSDE